MSARARLWLSRLVILVLAIGASAGWLHHANAALRLKNDKLAARAEQLSAQVTAIERDAKSARTELAELRRTATADEGRQKREERHRRMYAFLAEEKARLEGIRRPHGPPAPSGSGGNWFAELMADPGYAERMARQMRWMMEVKHAELFSILGLDPARLEQFKRLLVEQRLMSFDVASIAAKHGLKADPESTDELWRLRKRLEEDTVQELRSILGEAAFARYHEYQITTGSRETVAAFSTRLSYSEQPLRPEQATQLVELFRGMQGWYPGLRSTRIDAITEDQLARAAAFLSPDQLQHLRGFRDEQMASIMKAK